MERRCKISYAAMSMMFCVLRNSIGVSAGTGDSRKSPVFLVTI